MDTRDLYKLVRELSEERDDVVNLYDSVDLELNEGFVIETGIVGFMEDGVIVHLDEDAMEFLGFNGVLLESEDMSEGAVNDAVAEAVLHRISRQHTDLLSKFGPQAVMDAVDDLAADVGEVEEIGSSDVSIWTRDVIDSLEAGYYKHLHENPVLMAVGRAAAAGAGSELAGRVADKIGLEEGGSSDVEEFKAKISTSNDPFELVYDAISGKYGEAIRVAMQDMYDDIVIDFRLHPDDDFEPIIDKMLDYLDADSVMKEGSDNFNEAYPSTDIQFDARSTADYAEQISQAIQKVTGAPVSITPERGDPRDEGKYNLVVNPSTDNREVGYIVKDGNDGATLENISKAIDPFYRMFREKGWVFTQPFRGAFTIGVPAPDELAEIKRLAGQEEVDEGLGKALLGGAALIAAITGVNKMEADSMMKTEPQLVTLAQMRQEAFVQNDDAKVKELDDRIQKTMDHISVTGRPVMGIDGVPVDPRKPVGEAEYQGREVTLNKPTAGDVAKSKVYVKNAKGNVVKVNFGDKNMTIKKSNPARRKSFRARHRCENPGPKWKARYWSCRAW